MIYLEYIQINKKEKKSKTILSGVNFYFFTLLMKKNIYIND